MDYYGDLLYGTMLRFIIVVVGGGCVLNRNYVTVINFCVWYVGRKEV